ncbi:MAG TPA: von Willebrand factor type A domain-containing protein, partial [Bacteroidia bacterium]|nr:von Willebrand factor type A domain-containing protein [Bacteroidia bacterium]
TTGLSGLAEAFPFPDPAAEAAQTKPILFQQENVRKAEEVATTGLSGLAEAFPFPDPAAAAQTKLVLFQQENVRKADEFALRGSQLLANGDHQGAIDQYREALDLLPDAPIAAPRRRAYVSQFSRASVLLAIQRAEEGRYPESIALVEDVLQPSVDPDNIDARRLLERLNDPDYYSPALTPSHLERVRRVKLAQRIAQGYIELGDHDRAEREFNKVLNEDPYSTAARRGMEDNERHKLNYYDTTYNHTRAKMLREVAAGWESPVPAGGPQLAGAKLESLSRGAQIPAESSTARYAPIADGSWASPLKSPLSTFSIDVDTASWTNLRGMVRSGLGRSAIPKDAVRIEELVNYFPWDYPQPEGEHPFAFATEVGPCPWNERHRLLRVGIQGKAMPPAQRPAANLVFLVDVSGSMGQPEKLPLVKRALAALVGELNERDCIAIVTYAGSDSLALPPTLGRDRKTILGALDRLEAGGSTNGGSGIRKAYELAGENRIEGGINRVILCTDGDFNVGVTGTEDLVSLVKEKAQSGMYLSVLGFGRDNLNDAMLEEITNRGNGNYFYIDSFREALKVFFDDLMGTLVTIAKDVKIQVEFNPSQVFQYRLVGYANRRLENEDFANDEVDAGEVGAGHAVTALYEIVPKGDPAAPAEAGELRYQKTEAAPRPAAAPSDELAFVKLRYKRPDEERSLLMEQPVAMKAGDATNDFRFASAVALFGMILREQQGTGGETLQHVIDLASSAKGPDPAGHRAEFI